MVRILGAPFSGADLVVAEEATAELRQGPTPQASIIVLRDPRTAVGALVTAWESRRFAVDPQPSGWWGEPWSFALIDGWEQLRGRPLTQVCARQWLTLQLQAMEIADGATAVSFEEMMTDPRAVEARLTERIGVPLRIRLKAPMDPYRRPYDLNEVEVGLVANSDLLDRFLERASGLGSTAYRSPLPDEASPEAVDARKPSTGTAWHSAATTTVPQILAAAGASLLITTYKAGQAIIARTQDGSVLDTHFTQSDRPMGTAVAGSRVALGSADSVVVYARHEVGAQVPISPTPDMVLVPKAVCFTGDVAIHDMGWDGDGNLWFVNTRFSCLSKLDLYSSFTCEWKPSWISSLAAEDRCHLNGLAMVDGRPRYVTALARSDEAAGWRQHKGTGGVIIDITNDQVMAEGLSMPHSPRWRDGALWFLQSGTGAVNRLEADGSITEIARLPGFTRGLAFINRFALVGLSQVRESVFTGLPVTESADERNCGVWVVDTRTGATAGFIKFTGSVTEIFDVNVLNGRWPHVAEPGELTRSSFAVGPDVLRLMSTTTAPVDR